MLVGKWASERSKSLPLDSGFLFAVAPCKFLQLAHRKWLTASGSVVLLKCRAASQQLAWAHASGGRPFAVATSGSFGRPRSINNRRSSDAESQRAASEREKERESSRRPQLVTGRRPGGQEGPMGATSTGEWLGCQPRGHAPKRTRRES